MIRYILYLFPAAFMEMVAAILAPVLPLFAREGYLPPWLAWFQTSDNPLYGDAGWRTHVKDPHAYGSQVRWLLRNRAYGFKWTVLAAPVDSSAIRVSGNAHIRNREQAVAGWLHIAMGRYWQWKCIWPIPGTTLAAMFNFGWLIDPYCSNPELVRTEPRALFMCSPRLTAFHPAVQD